MFDVFPLNDSTANVAQSDELLQRQFDIIGVSSSVHRRKMSGNKHLLGANKIVLNNIGSKTLFNTISSTQNQLIISCRVVRVYPVYKVELLGCLVNVLQANLDYLCFIFPSK